uniref:ABC transporter ATP-binding protein n=1 Tax=Strongyloides venezuelensis TaxID=75913 RepID=A0A0K0F8T8_STRVS
MLTNNVSLLNKLLRPLAFWSDKYTNIDPTTIFLINMLGSMLLNILNTVTKSFCDNETFRNGLIYRCFRSSYDCGM